MWCSALHVLHCELCTNMNQPLELALNGLRLLSAGEVIVGAVCESLSSGNMCLCQCVNDVFPPERVESTEPEHTSSHPHVGATSFRAGDVVMCDVLSSLQIVYLCSKLKSEVEITRPPEPIVEPLTPIPEPHQIQCVTMNNYKSTMFFVAV